MGVMVEVLVYLGKELTGSDLPVFTRVLVKTVVLVLGAQVLHMALGQEEPEVEV